jgi:hypoxanthine phosphoribosyltransferase
MVSIISSRRRTASHSLLIVDDVFDSGRSLDALLNELAKKMRLNMPARGADRDALVQAAKNRTTLVPDYYLHETDEWIVFPHELAGLEYAEIEQGKAELRPILDLFARREQRCWPDPSRRGSRLATAASRHRTLGAASG